MIFGAVTAGDQPFLFSSAPKADPPPIIISRFTVIFLIVKVGAIGLCSIQHHTEQRRTGTLELFHRVCHQLAGSLAAHGHQDRAIAVRGNVQ